MANIGIDAGSDTAEDGRAEQDRFLCDWGENRLATGIREDLPDQRTCPRTAADDDPFHRSAGLGLRLDDLAQSVTDATEAGVVESDEVVEVALHS